MQLCIIWMLTLEHSAVLRVNTSISIDYFAETSTTCGLKTEFEKGNLYFKHESYAIQKTEKIQYTFCFDSEQLHSLELFFASFDGTGNKTYHALMQTPWAEFLSLLIILLNVIKSMSIDHRTPKTCLFITSEIECNGKKMRHLFPGKGKKNGVVNGICLRSSLFCVLPPEIRFTAE